MKKNYLLLFFVSLLCFSTTCSFAQTRVTLASWDFKTGSTSPTFPISSCESNATISNPFTKNFIYSSSLGDVVLCSSASGDNRSLASNESHNSSGFGNDISVTYAINISIPNSEHYYNYGIAFNYRSSDISTGFLDYAAIKKCTVRVNSAPIQEVQIQNTNATSFSHNWVIGSMTSSEFQISYVKTGKAAVKFEIDNIVITAVPNNYNISATSSDNNRGTVSGSGSIPYGTSATVTATPNYGYEFVNWTEDGAIVVGAGVSYTFPVAGPRNLVANFQPKTFTVNHSAVPTNAGKTELSGSTTFLSNVTLTATDTNSNYSFIGWYKGGLLKTSEHSYAFVVRGDSTYEARYVPIYKVTIPTSSQYNISYDHSFYNPNRVLSESSFAFTVVPTICYSNTIPVVRVNNNVLVPNNGVYTISNINENQVITVETMSPNTYLAKCATTQEGFTYTGNSLASCDSTYRFTISVLPGYSQSTPTVKVNGLVVSPNSTVDTARHFEIPIVHDTVTVTVEGVVKNTYSVSFNPPTPIGYTIDQINPALMQVEHGSNFSFRLTLDSTHNESTPIVKIGNTTLSAGGTPPVFTYIANSITEASTISISNISINKYQVTFPTLTGITFNDVIGSDHNAVEHGSDFSFTCELAPAYSNSKIKIYAGANLITPSESGVYVVNDMIKDTNISVSCLLLNTYDTLLCNGSVPETYNGVPISPAYGNQLVTYSGSNGCDSVVALTVFIIENPADFIRYYSYTGVAPTVSIPQISISPSPSSVSYNASPATYTTIPEGQNSATTFMTYTVTIGTHSIDCNNNVTVYKAKCGGENVITYDGYTYRTILIGNQCWLRENLRYLSPTGCMSYDNNNSYVPTYGYLYTWYAAMGLPENSTDNPAIYNDGSANRVQGICPEGWAIPTSDELTTLQNALGDRRSPDPQFWQGVPNDVTNPNDFDMVPAGYFDASDNSFKDMLLMGLLWSTSYTPTHSTAYTCPFGCNPYDVIMFKKSSAVSVRCIKDGRDTVGFDPVND